VLHDRHELNSIIPKILNSRQDILRKLLVRAYPTFRSRDTDMGLIDRCVLGLGRARVLEYVCVRLGRVPKAGIINGGDAQVLGDAFDPGWQAFDALVGG